MTINERLHNLEKEILYLKTQLSNTDTNKTSNYHPPVTYAGGEIRLAASNRSVDIKSGFGAIYGGPVVWNNTELERPPMDEEPDEPSVGYNKHTHTRYSGGALLADYVEVVQYDWANKPIENKHSQGYWQKIPRIKTVTSESGKRTEMIGKVSFAFDADSQTWGCAAYEIDVEKCYLVQYEIDEHTGQRTLKLDSKGQEMRSLLYDKKDETKSSVIWDENSACWRFLAVYAPEVEEEEEE